jgi:hypothetical protein
MNNEKRWLAGILRIFMAVAAVSCGVRPSFAQERTIMPISSPSSSLSGQDGTEIVIQDFKKILDQLEDVITRQKDAIKADNVNIKDDEVALKEVQAKMESIQNQLKTGMNSGINEFAMRTALEGLKTQTSILLNKQKEKLKVDRKVLEEDQKLLKHAEKMREEAREGLLLAEKIQKLKKQRQAGQSEGSSGSGTQTRKAL